MLELNYAICYFFFLLSLLFDPRFYPRYLCHYFALASLPPVSRLPALVRVPPWVAGPGPTLLPQSTSDAMGSLQTCAYISHWPNLLFFPVPRGAVCERAWLLGWHLPALCSSRAYHSSRTGIKWSPNQWTANTRRVQRPTPLNGCLGQLQMLSDTLCIYVSRHA